MAKLTRQDVVHVAELANLTLTDSEIDKFLPQLSKVLEYVGQLEEVDTSGVLPTSQTTGLANVLRNDELKPSSISKDIALSGTDSVHNDYFKVDALLTQRTDK
jgi:aspartyl-tRNA(Asn)/glutamyl-tRNA(Gln) amidotransferase subunit C